MEYLLEAFIRQERSHQHQIQKLQEFHQYEIQELKEQIKELHLENRHLEMLNQTKDDKIAELESLVNPYSSDGRSIADSGF